MECFDIITRTSETRTRTLATFPVKIVKKTLETSGRLHTAKGSSIAWLISCQDLIDPWQWLRHLSILGHVHSNANQLVVILVVSGKYSTISAYRGPISLAEERTLFATCVWKSTKWNCILSQIISNWVKSHYHKKILNNKRKKGWFRSPITVVAEVVVSIANSCFTQKLCHQKVKRNNTPEWRRRWEKGW